MAIRLARAGAAPAVWNRTRAKAEATAEHGCAVADDVPPCAIATWFHDGVHPRRPRTGAARRDGLLADPERRARHRGGLLDRVHRVLAPGCGRRARARRRVPGRAGQRQRQGGPGRQAEHRRVRPRGAYERVAPCSPTSARARTYVGEGDVARLAKICHNLMLGVVTQCLAEITVLAEKGGMSRAAFLEFLNNRVMGSVFTRYKSPAFVHLDYTPTFTPLLLRKDFDLGFAAAHELDVPMPVAALPRRWCRAASAAAGSTRTSRSCSTSRRCSRASRSSRRTPSSTTGCPRQTRHEHEHAGAAALGAGAHGGRLRGAGRLRPAAAATASRARRRPSTAASAARSCSSTSTTSATRPRPGSAVRSATR